MASEKTGRGWGDPQMRPAASGSRGTCISRRILKLLLTMFYLRSYLVSKKTKSAERKRCSAPRNHPGMAGKRAAIEKTGYPGASWRAACRVLLQFEAASDADEQQDHRQCADQAKGRKQKGVSFGLRNQ